MEVEYCRLVTISTDNITLTNEYRSDVGAHWPFPYGGAYAQTLGEQVSSCTQQVDNLGLWHSTCRLTAQNAALNL
jgi:hypothetical protein